VPTVAEQLRAAREARKLSVAEVAEITKLKGDHVRALENGDYSVFAAPVYIRGFIRTYGKLLKLDVPALIQAVDEELGRSGRFEETSANRLPPKTPLDKVMLVLSRLPWRMILPVAAVLALLALGVTIFRGCKEQEARDPLSGIPPAQHRPARGGDTLPLPAPPASPARK
jgi:cytoskeleton protein RodZ